MPSRPWRSANLAIVLLVAACGPGASPSPGSAQPEATPTPVPGTSTSSPAAASSLPTQSDTSWGRIWDGLPAGFPHFAAAEPTEVGGTEPTSATLDVPASAGRSLDVMSYYRSALEAAGYSVSVDGPLEDGSFTVSATAAGGCAAQVSVAPTGGSTTVTILYGAACPFE